MLVSTSGGHKMSVDSDTSTFIPRRFDDTDRDKARRDLAALSNRCKQCMIVATSE